MSERFIRVKMLTYIAGHGLYAQPGDILLIEEAIAKRLIVSAQAEPVSYEAETHMLQPQERNLQRRRIRHSAI